MAHGRSASTRAFIARPAVVLAGALIALSGSRRARAADDAPAPVADPPALASYPPALASDPPWVAPPTVVVELQTSDPRVRIDRLEGDRNLGTVCWAPCGLPLDSRGIYTITGDGIPPTQPFSLSEAPSRVTLTVDPGSRSQRVAGWALLFAGGVGAALGFALSPADAPAESNGMRGHQSPVPALIGLAGLALAGAGVAQLLDATTRVTSSTGRSLSSQ